MKTFFFLESTCICVLGPWPWPRAFLFLASRVSVLGKAVLGLGFFCVLGLEPCVLDSTSALNQFNGFNYKEQFYCYSCDNKLVCLVAYKSFSAQKKSYFFGVTKLFIKKIFIIFYFLFFTFYFLFLLFIFFGVLYPAVRPVILDAYFYGCI